MKVIIEDSGVDGLQVRLLQPYYFDTFDELYDFLKRVDAAYTDSKRQVQD